MSLNIRLFFTFFQIGLFSIGGGYAIIPLIQQEIVEKASWISQKAFTDMITISQMTPGPLAVNASTFVGLQTAGLPGAILATTGCILAGVCISAGLYSFFLRHEDSRRLSAALNGLKSASLGLIVSAAASILLLAFTGSSDWTGPRRPSGCHTICSIFLAAAETKIQSHPCHEHRRNRRRPSLPLESYDLISLRLCFTRASSFPSDTAMRMVSPLPTFPPSISLAASVSTCFWR